MAKRIGKPKVKKSSPHSGRAELRRSFVVSRTVRGASHKKNRVPAKTLPALARLELIKKGIIDKPKNNSLQLRKGIDNGIIKTIAERDSRICKERKIRRSEIMAKTRGRGLRVRHTTWSMDSFIQCRS